MLNVECVWWVKSGNVQELNFGWVEYTKNGRGSVTVVNSSSINGKEVTWRKKYLGVQGAHPTRYASSVAGFKKVAGVYFTFICGLPCNKRTIGTSAKKNKVFGKGLVQSPNPSAPTLKYNLSKVRSTSTDY